MNVGLKSQTLNAFETISLFLDAIASLESALSVGWLVGWLVLIVEQYLNGEDRRWIGNG